jgi:hypothetical protein
MEEIVPVVLLGAIVTKFVDFLKALRNQVWNDVFTQAIVWVAGVVGVFIFAETQWSNLGFLDLAVANGFDKTVLGLQASSLFSVAVDFRKAFDQSDSAKTPPLFPTQPDAPQA